MRQAGNVARKWLRRGLAALSLVAALALVAGGAGYCLLRASLPLLQGGVRAPGLAAPATVTRDADGVPTLLGRTRVDLAWVLGYLHGQERFFQMDNQRRSAAGELAELWGEKALELDRDRRIHRFRHRAAALLAQMDGDERRVLDAYVSGVNQGLAELGVVPFEYWLLGARPAPWTAEDTVLTVYAMYFDLQEADGATERRRADAEDALGRPMANFLFPDGTSWDAPLDGSVLPTPALPDGDAVRKADAAVPPAAEHAEIAASGSNAWAIGGGLSARRGAMVANDMHLRLRVPNVWYRARLVLEGNEGKPLDITGVTLPGTPIIVAGSNRHIAWGFTNSYADTSDVVILEPVDGDPNRYLMPDGPKILEARQERLCAKGSACETMSVEESAWGPVIGQDRRGRKLVYRWVAHDPAALDLRAFLDLERAGTAAEALDIAHRMGIPHQNLVVGDAAGNIGWTIAGKLPQRFGHDGRLPASWADGTKGWNGYLPPEQVPVVYNPDDARIWTANARVAGGSALAKLGFGGYAHGARASQIRDGLRARDRFEEGDMLAIQLDDRGLLLARWQQLLLAALRAAPANPRYAPLIPEVENWGGRAVPQSVGYRLVRTFRSAVIAKVYDAFTASMPKLEPRPAGIRPPRNFLANQADEPAWRLVTERPAHLVPPGYASWDAVITAALAQTLDAVAAEAHGKLEAFTWGAANGAGIQHPLARVVPFLSPLLDPPDEPLPGDIYQPRVAAPGFGASDRFVVVPGREETGIFHMPGGQSGHPLSPYRDSGHRAWAEGRPAPFLPGPARWRLEFQPS
jgi:penicillin amidase